jgi:ribonuclease Y
LPGLLAQELGADVHVSKAGALLHDIGKAVDHEIPGTHVEIGRKILAKYGVDSRVIQAMQSHHEEYPYETIESVIVQVADAVSGGRPGARRDTVDRYITRLQDLEAIALAFAGIERVYMRFKQDARYACLLLRRLCLIFKREILHGRLRSALNKSFATREK